MKKVPVFLLLVAIALSSAATAGADKPLRLFVLHSYSADYPWTEQQSAGFIDALRSRHPESLVIESEYLNAKRRVLDADYSSALTDFLRLKYNSYAPDAIYASDDAALSFLLERKEALFPGVPLFYSGINDSNLVDAATTSGAAGARETKELKPNIELLAAVDRLTSPLLIVGDQSPTYRAIEKQLRRQLLELPEVNARFISERRLTPLLEQLRAYPGTAVVLSTLGGLQDNEGQTVPLSDIVRQIVSTAPRLILTMEDVYLVDGVLGGFVTSGYRQGEAAAELLDTFLRSGEMPTSPENSPNEYLIDARELERQGIQLPLSIRQQARILHPIPTPWQQLIDRLHGALYILVTLLIVAFAGFLLVLSRKDREIEQRSSDLADQVKIAIRNRDSLNEAQRLARQGSWEWDLATQEFHWSDGLWHLCWQKHGRYQNTPESYLQYFDKTDRREFLQAIERLERTGEQVEFLHRLQRADGELRTVRETIRVAARGEQPHRRLIGTVQDVTERFVAETRLRESEEKYRRLFELSDDPMCLLIDERIAVANQAASRLLEYASPADLVDCAWVALSPPLQPDGRTSQDKASDIKKQLAQQRYLRFEWMQQTKYGETIPLEVSFTRVPYQGKEAVFAIWRDISTIQRAQRALEEQSTFLHSILCASERIAIVATDAAGIIRYCNRPAENLFHVSPGDPLGFHLNDFEAVHGLTPDDLHTGMATAVECGEFRFTLTLQRDNSELVIDARLSPIMHDTQSLAGYALMCEDVTEQRRAAELIQYQASYDPLTDLPNRRLFHDQLYRALAHARRHKTPGAVLFLDLDNFKAINDSLGHPVGDQLLREAAARIRDSVREEDTVARLGGDEFVVLLPELSSSRAESVSDVQILANKLRARLAQPYAIDPHVLHVSASIGVTVFPSGDETVDDVLRQADTAMYDAKESGRDTVRLFVPAMQRAADDRLSTINQLREALPGNELELYFQPQVDLAGELYGAEVLLRWHHPERGVIPPEEFVPLAEEAGLVLPIGDWVLHNALEHYQQWTAGGDSPVLNHLAINVSALQFRQRDFVNRVLGKLAERGVDPGRLTLEMTETALLEDVDGTVEKMLALKRYGIRFSIDGFGTGYSSLAYLKRLPVDQIKIDRSFVRDILVDDNDAALVDTILKLASHIGLEVVAEGVESSEVMDFLVQRGCTTFQGYLLGAPASASEFASRHLRRYTKAELFSTA